MAGWYIYMVLLFVINVVALKIVIGYLVEPITWVRAAVIAIILTGIGAVAGMFLSPLMLIGVPA